MCIISDLHTGKDTHNEARDNTQEQRYHALFLRALFSVSLIGTCRFPSFEHSNITKQLNFNNPEIGRNPPAAQGKLEGKNL